ncbi:hypothetical protein YC2023_002909 [Brassica napus]
MILYDCDAEALSNSIRPSQSYSPTIKWRCCPRLVQFHGFISVEVLLDAPPESPKNSRGAKEGSVQISLSRRVSFFMMKPRLCPSQDQSSPVKSSMGFWPSPLRSTSCFSPRTLVVDIKAMRFPLLEARSWQDAKSNLVTVALGKDDQIAWCWMLGPPAGPSLELFNVRVAKPYALTQRDELVDELV